MGLFSGKKKVYVGVANSKMIPDADAPQALKDSVTAYISDSGKVNGDPGASLVDYTLLGMERSIVTGVKRLNRWVRKPGKYDSVGSVVGELYTLADSDVRDRIADEIQSQYTQPLTFYYLNNLFYDFGHFTRQVLIDRYSYDPTENSLVYKNTPLYLEDAEIHTVEQVDLEELVGPGFTSGYTPYRGRDVTRLYKAEDIVLDPNTQFDFFEVTGVNTLTVVTTKSITQTVVNTPGATPEVYNGETVVNNIPQLGLVSSVYIDTVATEETVSETTTVDETTQVSTTVKELLYITTENYKCTYTFRDTFSSYFYSQNMDWTGMTDEEIKGFIDNIVEPDIRIQVGYEYETLEGDKEIVYKTLTDSETNYVEDGEGKKPFGTFLPMLYIKRDFKFVEADTFPDFYKESKAYAKKLNLTFKDIVKQIKKEVNDQDKIMQTYLKFGVDYNSTSPEDLLYLHGFFKKYFKFCDTEDTYNMNFEYEPGTVYKVPGRQLKFKDKVTSHSIFCNFLGIVYGSGSVEEVGTITTGEGIDPREPVPEESSDYNWTKRFHNIIQNRVYKYFRKQITETTYEEIRVYKMGADVYVNAGKSAQPGQDEGSALLIPVDFDVVKTIKGFKHKEKFLYSCIYIEFLTYVVKKVKWYQRGVFKLIVFAVSVAITVFTGGAGVTVASVLMAAVTNFAIGLAIDFAIKTLAKVLSPEILKVVAVLVAVAGLAYGRFAAKGVESLSKAFTIMFMKANVFLDASTKLIKATLVKQGEEFKKEAEAFKDKMKKLEDYRKANSKYISDTSLSYLNEQVHRYEPLILGETLDAMIARTLNTNPGLVTIDYIHGYVGYITTLPNINETKYKSLEEKEEDDAIY